MINESTTLPNFLIIGERKCGTTSLYYWMEAHPDVYLHPNADFNFFIDDDAREGKRFREGEVDPAIWEASNSPKSYAAEFVDGAGCRAIGHKGPDLLNWRPAHERIRRYVPDARLIVLLRDPVKRAWSHYWNEVGKRREWLSFEDAIAAESERIERSAFARNHLSYVSRGFYEQSLSDLFQTFDQKQVLVISLEKTMVAPEKTLEAIYDFLGVDPSRGKERVTTVYNENFTMVPRTWTKEGVGARVDSIAVRISEGLARRVTTNTDSRRRIRRLLQYPFREPARTLTMPPSLRDRLRATYGDHIEKLEALLGQEFDEWRR